MDRFFFFFFLTSQDSCALERLDTAHLGVKTAFTCWRREKTMDPNVGSWVRIGLSTTGFPFILY